MSDPATQVAQAAAEIRRHWNGRPLVGVVLGTGMGHLASYIQADVEIPFQEIPYFPRSTAIGHKGQLVGGRLAGACVVAMEGRCHLYEGYTIQQITLPVRVMAQLGVSLLIVGNASGGVNPKFSLGDIMLIDSHINLMQRNFYGLLFPSSVGRNVPKVASPYDVALIQRVLEIARLENFIAHRGVYVAVTGPNFETRAEYRFLRKIGGDVIGMSTVPEVTVAVQLGMRVLALSTVTNVAIPDALGKVDAHDVLAAGQQVEPNLRTIVSQVVADECRSRSA